MADFIHEDNERSKLLIRPTNDPEFPDTAYLRSDIEGVYVHKSDAPRAALELLKAAGITPNAFAESASPAGAAYGLEIAVRRLEKRAEEAELDAEALELWKSVTVDRANDVTIPLLHREDYRRMARAARKLYGKEPA
jgi:hypothetical protein